MVEVGVVYERQGGVRQNRVWDGMKGMGGCVCGGEMQSLQEWTG